ncbi:MAG: BREX system P-loop protein BrxC [Cyanobium sp.]|uniref:BREX system P-loop protein BrxC n=1 Tax=Synechococcus sp. CS-1326 TaxID=2847978 RepID=UPI000DB80B34|nr:BREX system P-loop protein BrxC [Synechococcus sp. CS-1326]MCT0213654.1 BREX system P-loop protein BrxC [Synechococcus sp. CS-1326]PZV04575.1 MAG: BREX system P-loop protein BrxC [Cyanobium sp.]
MTKKIFETLQRDPRTSPLANNGQARITTLDDDNARKELEAELHTFVCDGQYGRAMEVILQSYLSQQGQARQNAAWIAGFYGCGKSHLQKMLGHLWANTDLGGGRRARDLVLELPDAVRAQFKELDTLALRSSKPLVAASGAMPSGAKDAVRATVLAILLKAQGFPETVPQARFCFWLQKGGHLDAVRAAVEAEGCSWFEELDDLYVSPVIASAVLERIPDLAAGITEAIDLIGRQFPDREGDITTKDFVQLARKALAPDGGELPHTMLVLDEVQQYISDSNDRATDFVELAEALQTELDSRVLLVASGQSALSSETPQLQKLKDRFRINVQLSDTDVETVIRKVILQKRPDAQAAVEQVLDGNAGEISKQLQDSGIKERSEDRQVAVADYPLLPTRRRFWEACFRSVDAEGTNSQLRSQLRIIFDAVKDIAAADVGQVITGDVLFQAMAGDLVNSGVLLNELNNRIAALDDDSVEGKLKQSLCGLAFLISRLPREQGADLGVRATARSLADLMVADLRSDSGQLRQDVAKLLEAMAEDGTLMKVVDQPGLEEYRLQTTEGAQWQGQFEEKKQAVRNDASELSSKREQLLGHAIQEELKAVKLSQGDAKMARKLALWISGEPPAPSKEGVVVWVRDGWGCSEKEVRDAAREAGADDPVLHVFLPRRGADDLNARIIEASAAKRVIDHHGTPSTNEGREARSSMQSRQNRAEEGIGELIGDVITNALVFKGGGAEEYGTKLAAKVQSAATEASLARLFPEFTKADSAGWGLAVKRARQGSDSPLEAVGHKGATETHPVARQVLSTIGAAKEGSTIRAELLIAPYGWPQDAIDAVLLALHRDGTLSAKDGSNNTITPGQLDQQSLAKAKFVPQQVRLTAIEKVGVRGVFGIPGVGVKPGEEEAKASEFLDEMENKVAQSGGAAPLPAPMAAPLLTELRGQSGPEQLKAILEAKAQLQALWDDASTLADRKDKRLPQWERLVTLLSEAEGLPVHQELEPQVAAILKQRSLLDPTTDYVAPLLQEVENALSAAMDQAQKNLVQVLAAELKDLEDTAEWKALTDEQRTTIAQTAQLPAETIEAEPLERNQLVDALQQRSLTSRAELADCLAARFANARTAAAQALEPNTQAVKLSSGVLKDEAALDAWWAAKRAELLLKLPQGPIQIN